MIKKWTQVENILKESGFTRESLTKNFYQKISLTRLNKKFNLRHLYISQEALKTTSPAFHLHLHIFQMLR